MVDRLPELSRNRSLRKEVESLPLLDLNGLDNHKELRLAHKILAFIASVYVWQDGEGGETELVGRYWKSLTSLVYWYFHHIRLVCHVCFDGNNQAYLGCHSMVNFLVWAAKVIASIGPSGDPIAIPSTCL
ncbi:unnamed protein product [Schistosoma margrebowiei]|uniref:Uncharacterized protein n=1 Tax=Schistosoma margrebowiei TaxID=48269 RepID=A0A3P8F8K2_9TREM|nr:unnamed protein product [Schistosoma margrebowiei]